MASPILCLSQFSLKVNSIGTDVKIVSTNSIFPKESPFSLNSNRSFTTGLRSFTSSRQFLRFNHKRNNPRLAAAWLSHDALASNGFTWSTIAVLPFYSLMIIAPKSELTKKSMESNVPYVVLGLVYAYLLNLSWTPDTLRLIFASKYFLPELSSITKLFSSEMSVSSAWVHILGGDLFVARQVFMDGLEEEIETRHSVLLCMLFCPIGIISHVITKELIKSTRNSH